MARKPLTSKTIDIIEINEPTALTIVLVLLFTIAIHAQGIAVTIDKLVFTLAPSVLSIYVQITKKNMKDGARLALIITATIATFIIIAYAYSITGPVLVPAP